MTYHWSGMGGCVVWLYDYETDFTLHNLFPTRGPTVLGADVGDGGVEVLSGSSEEWLSLM